MNNRKPVSDSDSDDFFPPLSSLKPASIADPWAISAPPVPPAQPLNNKSLVSNPTNGSLFNSNNNNALVNPWSSSSNTSTNTNSSNSPSNALNLNKDPWSSNPSTQNKIDDFDLFTSNRATSLSSPTNFTNINNNNNNTSNNINKTNDLLSDPFGDFFGTTNTSTSAINNNNNNTNNITNNNSDSFLNNSLSNQNSNSTNPWNSAPSTALTATKPAVLNPTRKTPESFLGENSSLVNLENLIPTSTQSGIFPSLTQRPKSTNPFGANNNTSNQPLSSIPTSNSSTQLNNPFMNQQAAFNGQKAPTISQMQNQSVFPSFPPPASSTTTGYSGLAQPLIVPPIMPLPFNATASNSFNQPQMHQTNMFNTSNNSNTNTNSLAGQTATNPFLMM